jgi:hypothetical protein
MVSSRVRQVPLHALFDSAQLHCISRVYNHRMHTHFPSKHSCNSCIMYSIHSFPFISPTVRHLGKLTLYSKCALCVIKGKKNYRQLKKPPPPKKKTNSLTQKQPKTSFVYLKLDKSKFSGAFCARAKFNLCSSQRMRSFVFKVPVPGGDLS